MSSGIEPSTLTLKPRPKNRLPDSKFSQQETWAWERVVKPGKLLIPCILIGVLLIIVGGAFLVVSNGTLEIGIKYSDKDECTKCLNEMTVRRSSCSACVSQAKSCSCDPIMFDVKDDLKLPVYMYYEIENFHQNHRRYVKSRDDLQLLGEIFKNGQIVVPHENCAPFADDGKGKYYFPCGAIANSMFSDVLKISKQNHDPVTLSSNETAWDSERKYKFRNPKKVHILADFQKKFQDYFVQPKDWSDQFWTEWWEKGGLENPEFINWMHPAPNPTFRKLYGIISYVPGCNKLHYLCKGNYQLDVIYRFDVARFKGAKHVILARNSFLGSQNTFILWFTILLGIGLVLLGVIFFFVKRRHKSRVHPGHRRFSANQAPSSSVRRSLQPAHSPVLEEIHIHVDKQKKKL